MYQSNSIGGWHLNLKSIGKRIQMRREVLGMKQEELAEHVNLSPNYISAIERE